MEDLILEAGPAQALAERRPMRALSVFAALALVLGGIALARSADQPTPSNKVVVDNQAPHFDNVGGVIGQTFGFGAAVAPQISIQAIVCPVLTQLLAAFGPLLAPVIAALRVLFGCGS